jgi:hypothetical protein
VAHAGHQTLFLMAAIGFVAALQLRPKDAVRLVAGLIALLGLTATVSSIRWADMQRWYEHVLVDEESPKKMVTLAASQIMSAPKNLVLGVGIGQFGSRASLISSGEYLNVRLPGFLYGESEYFRQFVRPAQEVFLLHGEGSAMSKPYFSALNILIEFGLPLTLLLLAALTKLFVYNRRLSRSSDAHARLLGVVANVGLVFFVLCCFVENYLEFPQAIFVPILLYMVAHRSVADRG